MRARDVVGKKIVGIRQQRARTNSGGFCMHLDSIELDDGSVISFRLHPMEDEEPAVEGVVRR